MPNKYGIFCLLIVFTYQLKAQKNIDTQDLVWTRYIVQFNFNEKWTPFFDVEERMYISPFRQHQFLPSVGTNYKLNHNFSLTAAMMYFEMTLPQDPEADFKELFQEIRPQIALNFKHKINERWSFLTRFKMEWRYIKLPSDSDFAFSNYRFRMLMGLKYSFNERCYANFSEEIHFNAGSDITFNVFDQNRITAGINYDLNSNFSVETGYLHWFQQQASGSEFFSRNIFYFTIKQNLNL